MGKTSYYLAHDNPTQWQSYIIEECDGKVVQMVELKFDNFGTFIGSICQRELHFLDKTFNGENCYGWTISKYEFDRILRLSELYAPYKKYLKVRGFSIDPYTKKKRVCTWDMSIQPFYEKYLISEK